MGLETKFSKKFKDRMSENPELAATVSRVVKAHEKESKELTTLNTNGGKKPAKKKPKIQQ